MFLYEVLLATEILQINFVKKCWLKQFSWRFFKIIFMKFLLLFRFALFCYSYFFDKLSLSYSINFITS